MDCSCIYVPLDEDNCVVDLMSKKRKARKEHTCNECGNKINKKDYYWIDKYIYEYEITNHKTCLTCLNIRENLFCHGYIYGSLFFYLRKYIQEVGVEDVCLGKSILELTPKAKEKVLKIMNEISSS